MNEIFCGLLRKLVLVFFDDILIYNPYWKAHLYHLKVVLKILQHHQLYVGFSKCSFGVQEVEYLGHTISGSELAMDQGKLLVVQVWPQPKNLKQLHGFLGLTGYYRRL